MIVLNENESRIVASFLQYCFGEALVNPAINSPIVRVEGRTCECYMTKWPQAPIRTIQIVAIGLPFREPNATKCIFGMLRRNRDTIESIDRFRIGAAASMCNPKTMTGLHDSVECSGHAPNGLNTFNSPANALML